jgi:hypothetical protein
MHKDCKITKDATNLTSKRNDRFYQLPGEKSSKKVEIVDNSEKLICTVMENL